MLRRWSSPEVILVVTDLLDQKSIQFHAIQQARQSQAKVLLIEVDREESIAMARSRDGVPSTVSIQETVERMVNHLRWSGIACEPIVVRSLRADEVPSIARSCCADRVLVSAPIDAQAIDQIIDGLEVPVCVVGRTLSAVSRYQKPSRRITLVLSLHTRSEIPIAFASRFAKESHSQLTIMLIFPKRLEKRRRIGQMQASFVSRLPSAVLREAKLLCPVELAAREGEPSVEILRYDSCFNQDFLILAPARYAGPIGFGMSTVRKIIRGASCPVLVLMERPDGHAAGGETLGQGRE
jgi:nucleotide-binding universal stress UspA family protein